MEQAIGILLLIGIVILFSGVLYAFTENIIGNWGENVSCTINKVNIRAVGEQTLFLNYFIGFNGIEDDIMYYGLHFLDIKGDMVQFNSVRDLGNQTMSLLDNDNTNIIVQPHEELQKTIAKTTDMFNSDNEYLAIGTISTKSNGQQISECVKIVEI